MKKAMAILAACVCLCFALAACSGGDSSSSKAETEAPATAVESSQIDESSEAETTTAPEESSEPEETTTEETTTAQEESSATEDSSEEEIILPDDEQLYTMAIDIISDAHNNRATIPDGVYKNDDGSIISNAIDANLDDRGYSDFNYEIEVVGEKVTRVSINGEETLY